MNFFNAYYTSFGVCNISPHRLARFEAVAYAFWHGWQNASSQTIGTTIPLPMAATPLKAVFFRL